jgi:protein-tyrosine-phosphatase
LQSDTDRVHPISPELVLVDPSLAGRRRRLAPAFRAAFVCTGNRFRSVLAEAAFRAASDRVPVVVESFGTLDLGPVAAMPEAVAEAGALGLDVSAHVARPLGGADLSRASLVIGFERRHVVAAVEAGAPRGRVFVLPELVDLVERIEIPHGLGPLHRALGVVARADEARTANGRRLLAPEIEDPIGRPAEEQRQIAAAVCAGATTLARQLFG